MAAMKYLFSSFFILSVYIVSSLGVQQGLVTGGSRLKRQTCPVGEYEHEGRNCCLCSAGQHLVHHCTAHPDDGSCNNCERGVSYSPHPNQQFTCLRCTSCSQPNANLEEAEPCTIARDRVCRCKKGHYCSSSTGVCKICHPCNICDADGIKEPCTAISDTVCNEAKGSGGVIAAAIVVPLLLLLAALGGFMVVWLRKRKAARRKQDQTPRNENDDNGVSVEMESLNVSNVDLLPFLPDIAEELGWNIVEHLAMRSGLKEGVIMSCKLDNQGDSLEQTLQLLKRFVEFHGRESPTKLLQNLRDMGKKAKAEKIQLILSNANSATWNSSSRTLTKVF